MIFVLMTSRSGSSMVCKLLAEHGLKWNDPACTEPRQRAAGGRAEYNTYENRPLKNTLRDICNRHGRDWPQCHFWTSDAIDGDVVLLDRWYIDQDVQFAKMAVEFGELAMRWSDVTGITADFIKVRRDPRAVADSHKARFGRDWDNAYSIALKRYALMDQLPGYDVYTDLLALGHWNDSGIVHALTRCGVEFDFEAADRAVDTKKFTQHTPGA